VSRPTDHSLLHLNVSTGRPTYGSAVETLRGSREASAALLWLALARCCDRRQRRPTEHSQLPLKVSTGRPTYVSAVEILRGSREGSAALLWLACFYHNTVPVQAIAMPLTLCCCPLRSLRVDQLIECSVGLRWRLSQHRARVSQSKAAGPSLLPLKVSTGRRFYGSAVETLRWAARCSGV